MLKMLIRMNRNKIIMEKKYNLDGIYTAIDDAFTKMGLLRIEETTNTLAYRDNGNERDYGRFGRLVNTLKKQVWFMDNVEVWELYDSEDSENPEDFNREDLLSHYKQKQSLGA